MQTAGEIAGAVDGLEKEVVGLLLDQGPLCPSQISVELVISLKMVNQLLGSLESRGIVKRRPDRDKKLSVDPTQIPWGS